MKYLSILLLCLLTHVGYAQWDWSIRGGSSNLMQSQIREYSNINCIETDQAGNVYLLAVVGGGGIKVAQQSLTGYSELGIAASADILLSSFTAEGDYRWSKVIGGQLSDFGYAMEADSLGNIYVTGYIENPLSSTIGPPTSAVHFDTDTVLPKVPEDSATGYLILDTLRQSMFLVKYDTAGNFQWLDLPEPDTNTFNIASYSMISTSVDIEISPNGHLYWLCYLTPGKFRWETDSIITQHGVYVVEYDALGNQVGITKVEMDAVISLMLSEHWGGITHFRRNHNTGEFIIGGRKAYYGHPDAILTVGNDTITSRSYIASFSSNGQLQWLKHSDSNYVLIEDTQLDQNGDIFITGTALPGSSFAGQIFNSRFVYTSPFLMKLSSTGNVQWTEYAQAGSGSVGEAIEVSNSEVALIGSTSRIYWKGSTDTIDSAPNQGQDAFIARFLKSNGDLVSTERVVTNFGGWSWGNAIAAGPQNTYYFGGNFDQGMYMGQDTLYKVGGQRSFFLTKYQCDVPEPSYTISGNNDSNSVLLTYTGPIADSVQWFMGDGTQLWGSTVSHTYTTDSTYRVCMRAYYACTDVMICDSVHAGSIGVKEIIAQDFSFYPNPTTGWLTLENLPASGTVHVYSLSGVLLQSKVVESETMQLDLSKITSGLYVLEYRSMDGQSTVRKVVKE